MYMLFMSGGQENEQYMTRGTTEISKTCSQLQWGKQMSGEVIIGGLEVRGEKRTNREEPCCLEQFAGSNCV